MTWLSRISTEWIAWLNDLFKAAGWVLAVPAAISLFAVWVTGRELERRRATETASLRDQARISQEAAARAEAEAGQLRRRLAPRHVTDTQRATILRELAPAPKGSVLVRCVLGDGEGLAFAKQVADVLRAAGWTVGDVSQGVYSGTNPVGFGIVIRSKQAPPPGAEVLFKALTRAGLPIGVAEEVGIPADRIAVTVGNKPSE